MKSLITSAVLVTTMAFTMTVNAEEKDIFSDLLNNVESSMEESNVKGQKAMDEIGSNVNDLFKSLIAIFDKPAEK